MTSITVKILVTWPSSSICSIWSVCTRLPLMSFSSVWLCWVCEDVEKQTEWADDWLQDPSVTDHRTERGHVNITHTILNFGLIPTTNIEIWIYNMENTEICKNPEGHICPHISGSLYSSSSHSESERYTFVCFGEWVMDMLDNVIFHSSPALLCPAPVSSDVPLPVVSSPAVWSSSPRRSESPSVGDTPAPEHPASAASAGRQPDPQDPDAPETPAQHHGLNTHTGHECVSTHIEGQTVIQVCVSVCDAPVVAAQRFCLILCFLRSSSCAPTVSPTASIESRPQSAERADLHTHTHTQVTSN